jgi:hypothetical protein
MGDSVITPDLVAVLILGLGGPSLGLVRWANRPRLGAALTLAFGTAAALMFARGASAKISIPLTLLTLAYPAAVAAGRYRETLLRLLASPRAAGIALFLAGPIAAGAFAIWIDASSEVPLVEVTNPAVTQLPVPEPTAVTISGQTDAGHVVPLFTRPVDELPADKVKQVERWMTAAHPQSIIRTAEADQSYNCHGWVFTNGGFWVRNESVDIILADNGYEVVEKPKAGDVVVYRDAEGHVTHTGRVRLMSDGTPIVESKWGHMGRFLHPAAEQPYGETWSFYRSQRRGHLVRVGDTPSSNEGFGE